MFRWIKRVWQGSDPVEFESGFGMAESVERLKAATRRSVFSALAQQEAVGNVKASHVSLQRVIPMVGNSFKPFFRGHFLEEGGKVILTGRFTMLWLVKVFMGFWFGCIACFIVSTLLAAAIHPHQAGAALLFGLGMMAAGLGITGLGQWFARNDAAWLSNVIQRALHTPSLQSAPAGATTGSDLSPLRSLTAMDVVAAALALVGLMSLGLAIVGVPSAYNRFGWAHTDFNDSMSRYCGVAYAALLWVLAYGIHRRLLLAWRAGLVFLTACWIYSLARISTDASMPRGDTSVILFGVLSFLVMIYWGRWWYAQRVHFHR